MSRSKEEEIRLLQTGMDPMLAHMQAMGIPVTRKSYLDLAGYEEPVPVELEANLPEEIQELPD